MAVALVPICFSDFQSNIHRQESSTELDSHADTCVVGENCFVTHTFDKTVSVTSYDPKLGATQCMQVVSAALAYDDPTCRETIILRAHQVCTFPPRTTTY